MGPTPAAVHPLQPASMPTESSSEPGPKDKDTVPLQPAMRPRMLKRMTTEANFDDFAKIAEPCAKARSAGEEPAALPPPTTAVNPALTLTPAPQDLPMVPSRASSRRSSQSLLSESTISFVPNQSSSSEPVMLYMYHLAAGHKSPQGPTSIFDAFAGNAPACAPAPTCRSSSSSASLPSSSLRRPVSASLTAALPRPPSMIERLASSPLGRKPARIYRHSQVRMKPAPFQTPHVGMGRRPHLPLVTNPLPSERRQRIRASVDGLVDNVNSHVVNLNVALERLQWSLRARETRKVFIYRT